ncbi:MAG: rhomboid family intramembrane serine protease [Nitrososphaeraceae archaeon]
MQIKYFPIATICIIVINGIIFAMGLISGEQTQIIRNYGFIPDQIFNARNIENNNDQQNSLSSLLQHSEPKSSSSLSTISDSITRLFTSMFVHASIAHIAFNLFALAYLGVYAERAVGVPRYILVYITSGIVAALFHGAIASYILHNGNVVLIGASGAISGVLGIAAVTGNTKAYYWLALQIVFAVIGSISALPIAFTAHVGGFIAGVAMSKVLVRLERSKRKSKFFPQP